MNDDGCCCSSSGCHVVPGGCQKGGWWVLVHAYLGWARPPHCPHLPSTRCACWGWRHGALASFWWWLSVTMDAVYRCVTVCRQHPRCVAGASLFWMVMGDGWRCRWWWWEGRSGMAMFEPCLLYLGGQVPKVGCIFPWLRWPEHCSSCCGRGFNSVKVQIYFYLK